MSVHHFLICINLMYQQTTHIKSEAAMRENTFGKSLNASCIEFSGKESFKRYELESRLVDTFVFDGRSNKEFERAYTEEITDQACELGHEVCSTFFEDNFALLTRQLKDNYERKFGGNYQVAICNLLHSNLTEKGFDKTEIGYGHLSQIWYAECESVLLEMFLPHPPETPQMALVA